MTAHWPVQLVESGASVVKEYRVIPVGPVNTVPTPGTFAEASLTVSVEAPDVAGAALVVVLALCAEVQAAASTARAPSDAASSGRRAGNLRRGAEDRFLERVVQ